jgi:hypothetical protein
MTAPTQKVRNQTFDRDGHACAALSVGCYGPLEWNHRESSGSGGRGGKAPAVTAADGVVLCSGHNGALESDAAFRRTGLAMGWKLLRNRQMTASQIPFYVRWAAEWWLPDADGGKQIIPRALALELLEVAGAFTRKGAA